MQVAHSCHVSMILNQLWKMALSLFVVTLFISWPSTAQINAMNEGTTNSSSLPPIVQLNRIMIDQNNACRAFDTPTFVAKSDSFLDEDWVNGPQSSQAQVWIGCSREKMPAIFKALTALPNETNLTQLWIWDSFVPVIPLRSFSKVRPQKLIIERSHTGGFVHSDVFVPLADRLTELELKNNVLQDTSIKAELFSPLRQLVKLDLSINQLTQITNSTFGKSLAALRVLSLYKNQIAQIADGSLSNMVELRSLNLANNRLTRITAATFKNLNQLEYLNLENNQINEMERDAFMYLTRLRVLNLGGNRLALVHFPASLPNLRQLFLNNNSLQSLDDIKTITSEPAMPQLETLHLDQNRLKSLESSDQEKGGLKRWPSVQVLSLASNEIQNLKKSDLSGLLKLQTLSLQANEIKDLDDGTFSELTALSDLFLSQNQLSELGEHDFDGLLELRVLALGRNRLTKINENTFNGLKYLEKLLLSDNQLKYLENTTFSEVQSTLKMIDLSGNPWFCDCKLLWLVKWVSNNERIVVDSQETQCANQQNDAVQASFTSNEYRRSLVEVADDPGFCDGTSGRGSQANRNPYGGGMWDPDTLISSSNNVWITVLGIVLGVVSICILLAVSYLYFQDTSKGNGIWRMSDGGGVTSSVFGRWTASGVVLRGEHALRRVPSDMVNLIPKCSTNPSSSAASTTGEKM